MFIMVWVLWLFFFFKQKTAYEMRIRDGSSDVCSSDLLALLAAPAVAADPTALVEDVSATAAGVEFMDYVAAGRVIHLGTGGTLVLSYLKSCVRETVTGGSVTVGIDQSRIEGGKVAREVVSCDGGKLALTAEQSAKSGTMVFRKAPTGGSLRSEEHTSELQSLMRISYAVFCLKKKRA